MPELASAFDSVVDQFRQRAARYGYARVETPAFESAEVFTRTSGESSDIASKEMYGVSLHGEGGLALRPEGTAPVARAYLEHGLHRAPQPVRLSYVETMFRGQRPQKARWRQFWQWGLECFGAPEPAADVEIIEFTDSFLKQDAGLTEYELRVNTIGDTACRPRLKEALIAYFAPRRHELCEECQRRLDTNVLRLLDSKEERCREIAAQAPRLRDLLCAEDTQHFADVTAGLDALGIAYTIDDHLVRGLDYYTRTVAEFTLTNPEFSSRDSISVAGAGRYDNLVEVLGGPATPGVGVAGGVDVLLLALAAQGTQVGEEPRAEVYVVSGEPADGADRLQMAAQLRAAGFRVAIDYSRRPLDRQLESAVKHGAKVAVIRGTPEARGGNVIVRDLVLGEQRVTRLSAAVTEVARRLGKPNPRAPGPD
jgi:histidyl-tRNA synthetase